MSAAVTSGTSRPEGWYYEIGGVSGMTEQQINEIIKALAYGETAEQAAAAEGASVADVQKIVAGRAAEIGAEREMLRKAGYIHE